MGRHQFNHEYREALRLQDQEIASSRLCRLWHDKHISREELETLWYMVYSKDIENLTVAVEVINFKLKEHETQKKT